MKILGTGLQGLIGSRIVDLLSSSYTFENISRTTGVDITNENDVIKAIGESDAKIVLHIAAKADVDGCENDKDLGVNGEAWKINVEGTQHVANACEQFGKKLIYVSTDFVFDGEKEFYTEEDTPHPVNWYAETKYEGEKRVQAATIPWLIVRIAYPYRNSFIKNDFFRVVKAKLEKNEPVTMVTDHIMTPTYVDNFVSVLDTLIKHEATGIYHTVGSQFISPYDAAVEIAEIYNLNKQLIGQTTRQVFFAGRAERPFRLALKNDKIRKLGVTMLTFTEGIKALKSQL